MDHLSPPPLTANAPLHWSQSSGGNAWMPVGRIVSSESVKRFHSESEDCDEDYSEGSTKDQCTSPSDSDSCQMLSRRKRRGLIEKKRRDRINTSLSELKRLVPSALEKQGSAKLEKAEILQMSVDYLKIIHSKGLDSLSYDPHKYAMDYHGMGFRECVAEVSRYLERVEGLDIQNPLRLRLTSHLQCCAAQRELVTPKSTSMHHVGGQPSTVSQTNAWSSTYSTAGPSAPSIPAPPPSSQYPLSSIALPPLPPSTSSLDPTIGLSPNLHHTASNSLGINGPPHTSSHNQTGMVHPHSHDAVHYTDLSSATSCAQPTVPHVASSTSAFSLFPTPSTMTSPSSGSTPYGAASVAHHQCSVNAYNHSNTASQSLKPYRPWGTEVAY